eukprot:COSAG01_NODE_758_length_13805_cov_23.267912_10_plen_248_part_00
MTESGCDIPLQSPLPSLGSSCNDAVLARWQVVLDSTGQALSLKNEAKLTLIKPSIDLSKGIMTIRLVAADESEKGDKDVGGSDGGVGGGSGGDARTKLPPLVLSLAESHDGNEMAVKSIQVCGDTCSGRLYAGEVSEWFSLALGREASLARRPPGASERSQRSAQHHGSDGSGGSSGSPAASIAFSNEGQFLVVSEESVQDLQTKLLSDFQQVHDFVVASIVAHCQIQRHTALLLRVHLRAAGVTSK